VIKGRLEDGPVPLGDTLRAQVVRSGRTPAAFAEAYHALANLTEGLGVAIDDLPLTVSLETCDGPGVRLSVSHQSEHEAYAPQGKGDAPLAGRMQADEGAELERRANPGVVHNSELALGPVRRALVAGR
jgi:hypothetical protein